MERAVYLRTLKPPYTASLSLDWRKGFVGLFLAVHLGLFEVKMIFED
jgi:hypothetical protein